MKILLRYFDFAASAVIVLAMVDFFVGLHIQRAHGNLETPGGHLALGLWFCLLSLAFAIWVTKDLVSGSTRINRRTYTREENPKAFFAHIIGCYIAGGIVMTIGVLAALNIIGKS